MSGGKRRFEQLAAAARLAPVPGGDVTARVMARVRARRAVQRERRPMLVFAGVYAAVCAVALIAAYQWLGIGGDPMADFFAMANEIMP